MPYRTIILILTVVFSFAAQAQITGQITDAATKQPVPMATISYHNGDCMTKADRNGRFSIERHLGWRLIVSCIGYKAREILVKETTPGYFVIKLEPKTQLLEEVTVKSKRSNKYRRKNNPAVELMRKVIAAKKKSDLRLHPYYRYTNYQQIVAAVNDLKQEDLKQGLFKDRPWLNSHLKVSPHTGKLILPFSLEETVTDRLYRKSPFFEKEIVQAHDLSGLTELFQTGDIFNVILKEFFTDIDIYDDQIRLLQNSFTSPIGRDAILFYHYYITDTVDVSGSKCYQLDFIPSNPQDFGFRGQLFVMADSSYLVKRCDMSLPKVSQVNWVEGMKCIQEFNRLDNGDWVLENDEMVVEMKITDQAAKSVVIRNTRRSDFSFDEIPDSLLIGNGARDYAKHYEQQDSSYWSRFRTTEQTTSKELMTAMTDSVQKLKGFPYFRFIARAFFENFIETGSKGKPSMVDIGPLASFVSSNFHDGLRLRAGGQTNANFHPHIFMKGYYAYGTKTHESYYDVQFTYSFNRPKYLPHEFPRRTISFEATHDVALPSDKYLQTDKDNVFSSAKISDIDKMFLYTSQSLRFDYEKRTGIKYFGELKTEKISPVGNIAFVPVNLYGSSSLSSIRYTEGTLGIRYAPKEAYLNTKQQRWAINYDSPVIQLQHTTGISGFLGGQYNYNYTEFEYRKRFWMPLNLGSIDTRLRGGIQWNQVPFPLLIIPAANMSYFVEPDAYDLINNMEFLNDRFASIELGWNLNGKLFNNIPGIKKLKWREFLGVKCLWGGLSDKNRPQLVENQNSTVLMAFPERSYFLNGKRPYCEVAFGIDNIFHMIKIEYIRRLSYLNLPTANKQVVKLSVDFKF